MTAAVVVAVAALLWPDDLTIAAQALAPATATMASGAKEVPTAATDLGRAAMATAQPPVAVRTELGSTGPMPSLGDLVVVVETRAGQQQNVPLALTWTTAAIATQVVSEQTTDEQATARFPRRFCTPHDPTDVPCVDLGFPSSGAHALQFDVATQQLSLFVPDQGGLRIEVVEASGAPIRTTALAELRVLQATPPADRRHFHEFASTRTVTMEATGLLLEVKITTADGRRSDPMVVTGPATSGAIARCVVRMPPRALFSAQILGREGRPLTDADVEVWLADGPHRLDAGRTNSDGFLAFPGPRPGGHNLSGSILFLAHGTDGAAQHGVLAADLQPSAAGALGCVQLHDCGLLCAGICVDADGQPAPGLELVVQVQRPAELRGRGPLLDSAWIDLAMTPVRSAPDGTFRIHGPPQFGRRLQLRARGKPEFAVLFVEGTPDLRCALPAKRLRQGFLRWPA